MLSLSNIYVQYGNRILLDSVNFVLKPGERVGLVGRNGAGKSTLLKIIAGEMSPAQREGNVVCPTHFTLGYLHQDMLMPKGKTVIAETMTAFSEILALEKELQHMENNRYPRGLRIGRLSQTHRTDGRPERSPASPGPRHHPGRRRKGCTGQCSVSSHRTWIASPTNSPAAGRCA